MLPRAEPRESSDGRRRQDSDVDCVHPSFVPSALIRFLALSVQPRPAVGRRCDRVPSACREIRCDMFVQNSQFNNPPPQRKRRCLPTSSLPPSLWLYRRRRGLP